VTVNLGNNTAERVQRILNFIKNRQLGMDQSSYIAPWMCKITASMIAVDANVKALLSLAPGDVLTIDATISEEYQGDYEIQEMTFNVPSGDGAGSSSNSGSQASLAPTIDLKLLQVIAAAYSDTTITAQVIRPSLARGGLPPLAQVTSDGVQRLAGTFKNNPVNANGAFTGANPLSQHLTSTQIDVSSSTMQFGSGQVSYNSGSCDPGSYGTWAVYARDPKFAGGAVTFLFTNSKHALDSLDDIVTFGWITTATGGGGSGFGGGGGGDDKGGGGLTIP